MWDSPGFLFSPPPPPRLLFRCRELGREEAAPPAVAAPASDPRSLLTRSGSSGCVARGLEPGRLVSEPSEVLRSGLLLVLLAQSEPEDEELRLVLAPYVKPGQKCYSKQSDKLYSGVISVSYVNATGKETSPFRK